MMERMVLEQYLKVLYSEVKAWIKGRDTAAEAAKLVLRAVTLRGWAKVVVQGTMQRDKPALGNFYLQNKLITRLGQVTKLR